MPESCVYPISVKIHTYTHVWKETYQNVKCFSVGGRIPVIFIFSFRLSIFSSMDGTHNKGIPT